MDFEAVPVRVLDAFYERLTGVLRRLPAQPFEQALDRGADFSAGDFLVRGAGDVQRPFAERRPQNVGERLHWQRSISRWSIAFGSLRYAGIQQDFGFM